MQNFDSYLQQQLANLFKYQLLPEEEKMLQLGQLEEFIYRKITSSKFRKNTLSDRRQTLTKEAISNSIKQQKPLYFIFGFGGYKNHWVTPHHPSIEWAEVFNMIYVSQWLAPIVQNYAPGVIYEYESEGTAIVVGNNHKQSDVDAYTNSFKSLIKHFSENYLPANFEFRYRILPDQYETNSLFYRVGKRIPEQVLALKALPSEELEHMTKRALFNLKRDGREDLTGLSPEELVERGIEGVAFNQVFLDEDYKLREGYFTGDDHLPVIGSYIREDEDPDNWIKINSCRRSNVAFWTSRGITRKLDGEYVEDIISISNYQKLVDTKMEESTLFTNILPNLNSIEVSES